jgi:methionyl-tRNA formyltransferase
MRVLFLGNHTVGVRALEAISEVAEVAGVVAHPCDPEDGVRYESVYQFAVERNWPVVRGSPKEQATQEFMERARPDLLWITDYRYLLPKSTLELASMGTINLHPSLLPKYRGRASINWALLHGESLLGLTAHFVDEGMDTGDLIAQTEYTITEDQDVGDCLQILYPLYGRLTREVLGYFLAGEVPRTPQDHFQATVYPRRRPEDGVINWNQSARDIVNLVRAVAAPYPGAFTTLQGAKLMLWKAEAIVSGKVSCRSGEILDIGDKGVLVQCGDGAVVATQVEAPFHVRELKTGIRLGT